MIFESFILNFAVALGLILALTFDYVTKFFTYWYVRHVPNKTPIPFFGADYHRILGIRNTTDEVNSLYFQHQNEKLVGSFKSRIPDLIVKDPDLIKTVLSTAFENFQSRGIDLDRSRDVCLRNNLFYTDGAKWTLLRRGFEAILEDMTCVDDCLKKHLPGNNGDTNTQEFMAKLLDAVFQNLLIDDANKSVITEIRKKLQKPTFFDKYKSYLKNIFPSLYTLFGFSSLPVEVLNKVTSAIQGSSLMKRAESVLQFQITDKNKNFKNKPEDLALGVFNTFISEGYMPCINVLTSIFYELSKNIEIQNEARKSDEYLTAVIKETLRMYPPYAVVTRKCVKAYKFPDLNDDTVYIDKHITVNVPVEALHRDSNYYNEANSFNPQRFVNRTPKEYEYLPFGAGPRRCVGEQLAMKIIKTVSKNVLSNYKIEPCESTPSKLPVTDYNFGRLIETDVWLSFKSI